jgi:flavorubredoxin
MLRNLSVGAPYEVAEDTFVIPTFIDKWPPSILPVHSMVIRGAEPVLIDTGCEAARDGWLESVFSVLDPEDVRWVILSHADHDHIGNVLPVLESCPGATIVSSISTDTRLVGCVSFPSERTRWVNEGESMTLADRTLQFVRPPLFDSVGTRAIFDTKSGVMWGADAFCVGVPGEVYEAGDVPAELFDMTFAMLNQGHTPWLPFVDPVRYETLLAETASLPVTAWLSAHGPVYRGDQISDVFDRTRQLAGEPSQVPILGQNVLDAFLDTLAEPAT